MYPFNIKAEDCSLSALYKLKAYANAAEIKYHYYRGYDANDRFANRNLFYISINNLLENFYVILEGSDAIFSYDKFSEVPNTVTKGLLHGGREYKFNFYADTDDACNGKLLTTKTIKLPTFNYYSLDPLCEGIEEYKLCDMWYSGIITREDFIAKVTEYKENLNKVDEEPDLSPQNKWDVLMDWLINNYSSLLFSIIILGSGLIIIIKVNEKRKRVL